MPNNESVKDYTVTVHVSSSPDGWAGTPLPGHVYYELSDGTKSYYYGFEPKVNVNVDQVYTHVGSVMVALPLDYTYLDSDGQVITTDNSSYPEPEVSREYKITSKQFDSLKSYSDGFVERVSDGTRSWGQVPN